MNKLKLFAAVAALLGATAVNAADMRIHTHHHYGYDRTYGLPYPISYLHNYGPGLAPETFAFYDGPATNYCFQGSAAYLGQDRRRHPCF